MNSSDKMMAIMQIRGAKGRNAKMAALAKYPELKNLLKLTYNPYIHFNLKPTKEWINQCGLDMLDKNTSRLLQSLAEDRLTGSAAKHAVLKEFARLEPFSQQLLFCILTKDMRMGMQAKSINSVWPGLIPEFLVQLAHTFDEKRVTFPIIGTYKIDGLRCIYENGHLYSRYGRRFIGLERLENLLKDAQMPRLDGELTVPGKTFDDLSGDIRSFKTTDNIVYNIFDVMAGYPQAQHTRCANVALIAMRLNSPMVRAVPASTLTTMAEIDEMFNEARDKGYEGLVLKDEDALPFNGRSYAWMKVKSKDTVDVQVTDIKEGRGKYENCVGALICDFKGVDIQVGGGLTDNQREAWYANPNLIIGKTIEVEYMEVSKHGALRHPRLKCVRGDK